MAPKNKKKNGFYFFMKEVKEREAAKGINIPMRSLGQYAGPMWIKMSAEEKEYYEELARRYRNNPSFRSGKMAGDGTLVEDNARQIEEEDQKKIRMKQNIKRYISVDCVSIEHFIECTSRRMFYFISFNILCCTETSYIPVEVGVVEYSISYGIHREMHMLIHPGAIPTGYTGQAKRLSEDVHNIDIFRGEENSERNMTEVYDAIRRFVNPSDENPPPLFCIEEDIKKNEGCLAWLAEQAHDVNNFEVWNANYLLVELREAANERLPSNLVANDLLTKVGFDEDSQTWCQFHYEKDCSNCALAYCKRLCYLLSDAVCPAFHVNPTERHIPPISVEEKAYVVIEDGDLLQGWNRVPNRRHLGRRQNYYENKEKEDPYSGAAHRFSPAPPRQPAKPPSGPRQPSTVCLAEDMNRMKLDMASAPVPGQGIGRGRRWN